MKSLWFFILFVSSISFGQQNGISFGMLRQNDDLTALSDSSTQPVTLYERLKWIPLGTNSSLSFGGSHRFQAESFINEQFGSLPVKDNIWVLNRTMFHAHLRLGKSFEIFGELNTSLINGKQNITPVDRDELSVNQLFMTYRWHDNWQVLVGRENFRLGSGRLLDVREGPNVRLSFDQVKLSYSKNQTNFEAFLAVPVQQQPGIFDNRALDTDEIVGGVYLTQRWSLPLNFDFYLIYKKEADKTWNVGTGDDRRTTIGLRHFGNWKGTRFNNEFVYQFGDFDTQSIQAWTASFNMERDMRLFKHTFTLGVKTEAISGDRDNEDNQLTTFDALYPRGAYFGRVARFGPSNLLDVHPYVSTKIGKFYLELDYVAFWRYSTNDGVYNPALILDYPSLNQGRFIAQQLGTITGIEINRHLALELETNLIFPETFLNESHLNNTLFHSVFTAEFRF